MDFSFFVEKVCYNNVLESFYFFREYAFTYDIPIICDEVFSFLSFILKLKKPKTMLEIGTAIGYSGSMLITSTKKQAKLHTIERNQELFDIARENFNKLNLDDNVTQYLGDASDVLIKITEMFDFVFIDGAKGQYLNHFLLVEGKLKKGALVIFDNIFYKGLIISEQGERRDNTIKNRMLELIDFFKSNKNYSFTLCQIGNGLLIVEKI